MPRPPPLDGVLLRTNSEAKALNFSGSSLAVSSGEVFRVPSAASSTWLPAAPEEHSLTGGKEVLEQQRRVPGPASLAVSR